MKTIQLVITESCNLSCDYCYMNNREVTMNRETFLEYYRSLPDSVYRIAFFGGEPLKNWELIEFITEYLQGDERCQGFELYSNGLLLTHEMVDFIEKYDISFRWSCDGYATSETRIGASWQEYLDHRDVLGRLNHVGIMIGPDNLNMSRHHEEFNKHFNITPSFRIIRDDIWSEESVESFASHFNTYIDFLCQRSEVPLWVERELDYIYKGVIGETYRLPCNDAEYNQCLMPDGTTHLCAKMATSDVLTEYNGNLYQKCKDCELNTFCEKQCHESVLRNGGVIDNICNLYKIMFNGFMRLDAHMDEKGDVKWKKKKNLMIL